jgi:demethylsterigmatocystin 6-O-methyltransferase
MDSIVAQIHALAESADEVGRLDIQVALRKYLSDLQSPKDVVIDLTNSVCCH